MIESGCQTGYFSGRTMNERSDGELLDAWAAGDQAAGSELFARHLAAVLRVFRYKADDAIEDLVQRTFLACVERRDRLEDRMRFRAYLLGIARIELLRHLERRAGPRGRLETLETSLHDLGPTPSTLASLRRDQAVLVEALRRLPLDFQIALELYYWEGLSGPELAEVLGVAEGTVRSRLRLGRQQLKEALASLGVERPRVDGPSDELEGWAASLRALADFD
jgi:RNA polymerase sigma-70 factor (ECF subfamily)